MSSASLENANNENPNLFSSIKVGAASILSTIYEAITTTVSYLLFDNYLASVLNNFFFNAYEESKHDVAAIIDITAKALNDIGDNIVKSYDTEEALVVASKIVKESITSNDPIGAITAVLGESIGQSKIKETVTAIVKKATEDGIEIILTDNVPNNSIQPKIEIIGNVSENLAINTDS